MTTDDRRRLLVMGALPSLVALLVAVGLWLLVHGNASGRDAYDAGRYADARSAFEGAHDLGVVSPWIAPFNTGTAAYRAKQYEAAVSAFNRALDDVPDDHVCDVRVDLALTHEAIAKQAEADGEDADRQIALRDGRTAIQGTGCNDALEKRLDDQIKDASSSNDDRSEDQKIDDVEAKNRAASKVKDLELEPKNEPREQIQW
ncbi:tetratricopeptide repeat protein [Nocardioides jiangxiensis]|uniref:Tetratricopeptide repeat protein n=1 Tax=Nocardioides jiangxiensis TaxID=3064524 RepID=A0ABT9B4H2_9ACTN|nr:tetratricopeptide repeat protein [Nocardioides sp. WY-20]MDO7869219.1 tetratricopeptide repeat protein [Nocardioides sp. WY-20]